MVWMRHKSVFLKEILENSLNLDYQGAIPGWGESDPTLRW